MKTIETNNQTDLKAILGSADLPKLAFTAEETAALLNVSTKTIYRLCDRGLLKRSSALRTLLISRGSILAFLEQ